MINPTLLKLGRVRGNRGGVNLSADHESNLILPRVDLPLSVPLSASKNIGFHWVWTVAYPLPIHGRGHESKALLADHGYSSRLLPSSRGAAAEESTTDRLPECLHTFRWWPPP